jgi:flagellar hook-associated protein 3 FlgL
MRYVSIGDLARTFSIRQSHMALQALTVARSQEVATGRAADLVSHLSGDFRALSSVERSITVLGSWRTAISEATLATTATQAALGTLQETVSTAGLDLSLVTATSSAVHVNTLADDAMLKLGTAVAMLNGQAAGRHLFSGQATDTPALTPAADIVAGLMTAVAGQATVADVIAAAEAWFDAPPGGGGFIDLHYSGDLAPPSPFQLGPGESATLAVIAADDEPRAAIKGLALAAALSQGLLQPDSIARAQLAREAGLMLLGAEAQVVALRADVGVTEQRLAEAAVRNAAETSAMELARNALIEVDPYEAATRLESVQGRMETLYALTARLSRLSLADFLR